MRRHHFAVYLSTACFWAASTAALDLDPLTSPVLFRGDSKTAYRDPAAIYHGGVFHLNRSEPVHVWEKLESTLQASDAYANPYTDAHVWVDLSGPGFARRCHGFWDGGSTFRVRLLATCPGQWRNAEHDSTKADAESNSVLPPFPGTPGKSDTDWALKLSL